MKQEAVEVKRHLVALELEDEAQLKAERTAILRKRRLEREETVRDPVDTDGGGTSDDESVSVEKESAWPWRLPQAHRR